MTAYIYALICPLSDEIRYIGKSVNPEKRYWQHIWQSSSSKRKNHKNRWLRKLSSLGLTPYLQILHTVRDGEKWQDIERKHIAEAMLAGARLTNITAGGEGLSFIDEEQRKIWLESVTQSLRADEVKARISEGVRIHSQRPDIKKKQRDRHRLLWQDPAYRKRMEDSAKRANALPDVKAKISAASKKRMADAESRRNVSDKLKAYYATEEGRQNKIRTSHSPEKRAKSAEGQRKLWADPDYRRRAIEVRKALAVTPEGQEKMRLAWEKRRAKQMAATTEAD